jgi:hypothetical protein
MVYQCIQKIIKKNIHLFKQRDVTALKFSGRNVKLNKREKIMSVIGGIGFFSLGLWFESTSSWGAGSLLVFGFVFFIAVVATMLSTRWKPQSWKVEK